MKAIKRLTLLIFWILWSPIIMIYLCLTFLIGIPTSIFIWVLTGISLDIILDEVISSFLEPVIITIPDKFLNHLNL